MYGNNHIKSKIQREYIDRYKVVGYHPSIMNPVITENNLDRVMYQLLVKDLIQT